MRLGAVLAVAVMLAMSSGSTRAQAEVMCDAATARVALTAFVQAFNQGRFARLQSLFAVEPDFGWYAVAPPYGRTGERSFNRATLDSYFRARHAKRETLGVLIYNFASTQTRNGTLVAHFNGRLTRAAADLPRERRGYKATIRCAAGPQFVVLSIGTKL